MEIPKINLSIEEQNKKYGKIYIPCICGNGFYGPRTYIHICLKCNKKIDITP